jgi:hypothetical protein
VDRSVLPLVKAHLLPLPLLLWEVQRRGQSDRNRGRLTPAHSPLDEERASSYKRCPRRRSPALEAIWAKRTGRLVWYRQLMLTTKRMNWIGRSPRRQYLRSRHSRVSTHSTIPDARKDRIQRRLHHSPDFRTDQHVAIRLPHPHYSRAQYAHHQSHLRQPHWPRH